MFFYSFSSGDDSTTSRQSSPDYTVVVKMREKSAEVFSNILTKIAVIEYHFNVFPLIFIAERAKAINLLSTYRG